MFGRALQTHLVSSLLLQFNGFSVEITDECLIQFKRKFSKFRMAFAFGLFRDMERLLEELKSYCNYNKINYIIFFVRNPTSSTGKVMSAH